MNNEFKVVIGIMRASNLLVDDLKIGRASCRERVLG